MKNTTYLLCTVLLSMLGLRAQAQQFFFSSEKPGACAATDGIVTIVPTRGVPPFTYLWSTGSTDLSIKNVPKGVYSATLTDATGATVAHSHILNSHDLDIYLFDRKPVTFCTPNSGALTIQPVGGVAPYTYTWSNGQTGATAQFLAVGPYSVTVQDATGCVALGEYQVEYQSNNYYPAAVIETIQEPDCINTNNGELQARMDFSGFSPYTYAWSNGSANETISALATGVYSVTVTDALGCPRTAVIALQNALTMTGNVVCTGSNTGTATAQLVNGAAPVSYAWSNGQTGPVLNNLGSGNYGVTATDANGCNAANQAQVAVPDLVVYDYSPKCYAGNNGVGSCWVNGDIATSYLWDNGFNDSWNTTLSPGLHSVTVTTALGCTLTETVSIAPPAAPPIAITYSPTSADCANGTGGSMNISISGGIPPYIFYSYGPNGFNTSDVASMQNLVAGEYYLNVYTNNGGFCSTTEYATIPDAGGFNPELVVQTIDCTTGYGSAAVVNVTMPGTQYNWSMGANTPDIYNLTGGFYSVTVTGLGSCLQYYNFDMYGDDSLQFNNNCTALATGTLFNDLGVAGCTGTTGIPFQLIRTLPSGALNFTDENGVYQAQLATGTFDLKPANYDPADIACPPGATHTVSVATGTTTAGLDFHFLNANAIDHRVRHTALRTAQPGYPYSLRFEVCNDGNNTNNGSMTVDYGNFFGTIAPVSFAQHPGALAFVSETAGIPDNSANFSFPGIVPGGCELLQVDFTTPTTTPGNTQFITRATVTPASGDPTPDNNVSTLYNTVVGSFDPNSVLAYPARNGNPHDGGDLLFNVDRSITYQVFFQNTGTAPADLVIVRDTIDPSLNVATIRNLTASHDMKVTLDGNNSVLVFTFPNINLADSTSDYANSIGSIQYDIDLAPGVPVGTEINKSAAIYFDFNSPVITNNNVLKVVNTSSTQAPAKGNKEVVTFPNPAGDYFGFYTDQACEMTVYTALGAVVSQKHIEQGLQQVPVTDLPNGIYLIRLDAGGSIRNGKVVVSH